MYGDLGLWVRPCLLLLLADTSGEAMFDVLGVDIPSAEGKQRVKSS